MSELDDRLDRLAEHIAQIVPDVPRYAGSIIYLLQALEVQAVNDPTHPEGYETMLQRVLDGIQARLVNKKW